MTVAMSGRTASVGETVPSFSRETGLQNWNRYAAVNDEFIDIHMDDDAGRAAGYGGAFGMGNLQWSYLHSMLRSWLGDDGMIRQLGVQFRSPNTKGQTVTARGVVTAVTDSAGDRIIELDVWTEDQDGNQLAPGTASVVVHR